MYGRGLTESFNRGGAMTESQNSDNMGCEMIITCSDPELIYRSIQNFGPRLQKTTRRNLLRIADHLYGLHGKQGLFDRFNNRTIESLLQEYESILQIRPIASGELDGMTYELYDSPSQTPDEEVNESP